MTPGRLVRMAYGFLAPSPCRNGVAPRFAAAAQPTSHQHQSPTPVRTAPAPTRADDMPVPTGSSRNTIAEQALGVYPGTRQPQRQKRHARLGVSDGKLKTYAKLQGAACRAKQSGVVPPQSMTPNPKIVSTLALQELVRVHLRTPPPKPFPQFFGTFLILVFKVVIC